MVAGRYDLQEVFYWVLPNVIQVCRYWDEVIRTDVGLLYKQELAVAGMEDGDANMDVHERRELLKEHQEAWETLAFTDDRIIDNMRSQFLRTYELQSGIFSQQTDLRCLTFTQIPSKIRGIPLTSWSIDNLDIEIGDHAFDPLQNLLVIAEERDPDNPYVLHVNRVREH